MHNQLIFHKIKTIRFSFPGSSNHFSLDTFIDRGHFINDFPCVASARNAELQIKVKTLQKGRFEIVPLNHSKIPHFFTTNFPNAVRFRNSGPK